MSWDEYRTEGKSEAAWDQEHIAPAISAIVVIPDNYETVRRTMECMKAQTAAVQMEIVIVAPSYQQLGLDESELTCFHSLHVVEYEGDRSISAWYVAGIRQANAPIIALTEDHSFPDANWAELLIAAHKGPWAIVGPSMRNGNPYTMLSWADFYNSYGEWAHPLVSGPVSHTPACNSSYKRDILLSYGDRLEILMKAENILHRHLAAQGHEFMLESGTCTTHINFTSWSSWIPSRFHAGRLLTATWAYSWSLHQRLLFSIASPLIVLVRLWRIQRRISKRQSCSFLMRLMPIVFVGLLTEWFGQMLGFMIGSGNSAEKMASYEFHRIDYDELTNQAKQIYFPYE